MTRSRIRSRRAAPLVVLLLLGAAGSCSKSTELPPISLLTRTTGEREDDTLHTPPAHLGGREDPIGPLKPVSNRATPKLDKRITLMTENEIIKYFKKLQFDTDVATTQTVDAYCQHVGGGPCGTGDSAHVFLQPEVGMYKWSNAAIPANGLIVGRIINYAADTNDEEQTFHFPGHRRTWWVVDRDGLGFLRSRYFVRTYNPAAPIRFVTLDHYAFNQCSHPLSQPPNPEAKAKFSNCARSMMADSLRGDRVLPSPKRLPEVRGVLNAPASSSMVPLPTHPNKQLLSDTWVTCDVGCCATS